MTFGPELLVGAIAGTCIGAALVPVTRRELVAAVARAAASDTDPGIDSAPAPTDRIATRWHRTVLIVASGLLPGLVILRAGWSLVALPPLLLLLGLVQLGYCDMTRFLLPRTMVHATTGSVLLAGVIAAADSGEWHRFLLAVSCGLGLFALLFAINLMNPAWMAFGDVRLAPAVGLGLGWISPLAVLQGFFVANILAAIVGLALIALSRGSRKTALPFGLYLAAASALIVFLWS